MLASMCLVRALANNGQLVQRHVRFWQLASVLLAPVRFESAAEVASRPGADIDQRISCAIQKAPPTGQGKMIRGSGWHEPLDRIVGFRCAKDAPG